MQRPTNWTYESEYIPRVSVDLDHSNVRHISAVTWLSGTILYSSSVDSHVEFHPARMIYHLGKFMVCLDQSDST